MKLNYLIMVILAAFLFSCKHDKGNVTLKVTYQPELRYDGKNLIDEKTDSVVLKLNNLVPASKTYNFSQDVDFSKLIKTAISDIKDVVQHEDKMQFSTCECNLDISLEKKVSPSTYVITYRDTPVSSLVEEYVFDDEQELLRTYSLLFQYTNYLRRLPRENYNFKCCENFQNLYYYVAINGKRLYLISDTMDFKYSSPTQNVQGEIASNPEIRMDDLFDAITMYEVK